MELAVNDLLRVSQVAERLGVCPQTLRKWEKVGKIPPAARDFNGHRRYAAADVEVLRARFLAGKGA